MSTYQTSIATRIKNDQPKIYEINKFLRRINTTWTYPFLTQMSKHPHTYTELMLKMGYKEKKQSGKFAYYIRKIMQSGLVQLDSRTREYYLTFRGIKALELLQSIDKIVNLNIGSIEDAETKIIVNLNRNKSWLEPLLQSEIQKAVKKLQTTKQGKCGLK